MDPKYAEASCPASADRVDPADVSALIAGAIKSRGGVWADVGAGSGTFTRALCDLLGRTARVYAVDRDASALSGLTEWARSAAVEVIPVRADFTHEFELPGIAASGLDGMLLANALHFVRDPERVLARLVERVRPGGRVVLVEYDGRSVNPWVPYPIPASRVPELAAASGLVDAAIVATRPSAYGGMLYVAAASRSGGQAPGASHPPRLSI